MRRGPFDPDDPFRQRRQRRDEPRPAPEPLAPTPRREAAPDLTALRAENQKLRAELKAVSERYVELRGDLERVRALRDEAVGQARREARAEGLAAVLEVADGLDRALANAPDRDSAWFDGVQRLRRGIVAALERRGIRPVGFRGEPFDPARHEALGTLHDPELPEGYIARVEVAGYAAEDGALLRPAKVLVTGGRRAS